MSIQTILIVITYLSLIQRRIAFKDQWELVQYYNSNMTDIIIDIRICLTNLDMERVKQINYQYKTSSSSAKKSVEFFSFIYAKARESLNLYNTKYEKNRYTLTDLELINSEVFSNIRWMLSSCKSIDSLQNICNELESKRAKDLFIQISSYPKKRVRKIVLISKENCSQCQLITK